MAIVCLLATVTVLVAVLCFHSKLTFMTLAKNVVEYVLKYDSNNTTMDIIQGHRKDF